MIKSSLLTPGQPIAIQVEEGVLYAGFIYSAGSCGELKTYAIFEKHSQVGGYSLLRLCNRVEKKFLGKLIYFYREIRPMRSWLKDGEPCALFIAL